MAAFSKTDTVRLADAVEHAVAHAVKVRDGARVKTRCGWQPSAPGVCVNLGEAVAKYRAFVCVRCFS